jgi:hypothetical protein
MLVLYESFCFFQIFYLIFSFKKKIKLTNSVAPDPQVRRHIYRNPPTGPYPEPAGSTLHSPRKILSKKSYGIALTRHSGKPGNTCIRRLTSTIASFGNVSDQHVRSLFSDCSLSRSCVCEPPGVTNPLPAIFPD